MKIHVGPFEVSAEVKGAGIEISAGIDWHGIKLNEHATLSIEHPSVSFNTPSIDHYSASISIGIDAETGILSATAKACHPKDIIFGRKECSSHTAKVRILPADGLCMLTAGVTNAGLGWLEHNHAGKISCSEIKALIGKMNPERINALKYAHGLKASEGMTLLDTVMHDVSAARLSSNELHALANLAPKTLEGIYTKLFTDPRVNAVLPGIAQKLHLKAAEDAASDAKTSTGQKVFEVISEVLGGLVAAAGLALGLVGILATLALAIVAAVAVGGGVLVATIVIAILTIFACVIIVVPAILMIFVAMIIGGYLTIRYGEEAPAAALV